MTSFNPFSHLWNYALNRVKNGSASKGIDASERTWQTYHGLRKLFAKKRLSAREKIWMLSTMLSRPTVAKNALQYAKSTGIYGKARRYSVVSLSDSRGNLGQSLRWGDFWVKMELTETITNLGGVVVEPWMHPDTVIHLFGGYYDLPSAAERVLWIHSHPDKITPRMLESYDRVYSISKSDCERISCMGAECHWLPMGTGKEPPQSGGVISEEVVFVGNALGHLEGHRPIVDDMLAVQSKLTETIFKVWGGLYQDLPDGILQSSNISYYKLDSLYANSAIVLNDHRPEMRELGYINPRILDVLASGGFVISDRNKVIDDIFGDSVPQYDSPQDLAELIDTYLNHSERRAARLGSAQSIAQEFTWERVARGLMG